MNDVHRSPSEPPPSDIDPLGLGIDLPDDDFVLSYVASMPTAYRRTFDEDAQHEHAAIVHRRGGRATHIEIWKKLPERIVAALVVADDRPGLLSRVSAALVAHDMDVVAAQAYGRRREDGRAEAVDLVWIRRLPSETGAPAAVRTWDVTRIAETLDALVRGGSSFEGAVRLARALRASDGSTRVRFERDARDGATLLMVEAVDRPGLLLIVSRTLFRERIQIVGSHVTTRDGHVLDRFHVTELDGSPLRGARQLEVQTAVLAALREDEGSSP
jgi:UTP:GlnB (protein PII) uridylyltransferase